MRTERARAIASEAGVKPSAVEVKVKPGMPVGCLVDAKIHTPTATATSMLSKMAGATSSAIQMLMKVAGLEIAVWFIQIEIEIEIEIAVLAIVHPATLDDLWKS